MTEITLSTSGPLSFCQLPLSKFRGTRLPGSKLYSAQREGLIMSIQQIKSEEFAISCRSYQFDKACRFWTKEEGKMLRLEIVLSGHLPIRLSNGKKMILRAGQYHITEEAQYESDFTNYVNCEFAVIYYPLSLVKSMSLHKLVHPVGLRPLPDAMNKALFEILQNPYKQELLHFFYDNMIRKLLLLHLAIDPPDDPEGLTEKEIAAIYEADNIIASKLDTHMSIKKLVRKVGLNEYTLKKGFKLIFNEGPFERLMKRRMAVAVELLETTEHPIKEIAERAGYSTLAGFITGFRRRFKTTPVVWREASRNNK